MAVAGQQWTTPTAVADRAPGARRHGPPLAVWLPAALIALLMTLPLLYLLYRTASAGPAAAQLLLRPRTLQVVVNSALLALTVTGVSALLSVPLAWLLVRTD